MGEPFGEPAFGELEAGEALFEEGLGNPVAFAFTVIDCYAGATGDLVFGTGELSRAKHSLGFSSAAVARSACEYAGIGWWLSEPGIGVEQRIARVAHLVDRSLGEAKGLLAPGELSQFEHDSDLLLKWAKRHLRKQEKLPNASERFVAMSPQFGKVQYTYLSMLAHGHLSTSVQTTSGMQARGSEHIQDLLWRINVACWHGLKLAHRVGEIKGRPTQRTLDLLEAVTVDADDSQGRSLDQ